MDSPNLVFFTYSNNHCEDFPSDHKKFHHYGRYLIDTQERTNYDSFCKSLSEQLTNLINDKIITEEYTNINEIKFTIYYKAEKTVYGYSKCVNGFITLKTPNEKIKNIENDIKITIKGKKLIL